MPTQDEVLKFITDRENDVKFVRLAFCDLGGVPKNISVPPTALGRVFEEGMAFEPRAIDGFGDTCERAYLFPDVSTLATLPWRPSHGRVVRFYCDIRLADGNPAPFDKRAVLKREVDGLDLLTAEAECDFYLFKTEEDGDTRGATFDNGGYFDVYPLDMGENVRREICNYLAEMGIVHTASHHARGHGQNTIALSATDFVTCADNLLTFRMAVSTVARQNGLIASFDASPFGNAQKSALTITVGDAVWSFAPSVNPYTALAGIVK
ncbi:MAG: glutamine synthetase beta-grasp domain-containing protein [Oscillospiraceae bacterium]|jgi:glutamine synthetase|nr:glutamine synthetase beta-grasp domain-containing protein [Oscillospiraceae bacterium]